jgi:drug/metabolite transporter (DMT)-like permease
VAGGLLLGWMWLRGHGLPNTREWRNAAIIGAMMLLGGMGCVAYAEQTVASGLVVVFIAISPVLMALANLPFGIRPQPIETVGIAIAIVGVVLLASGAGFSASPVGLAAVGTATICWAVGSVLSLQRFTLAPGSLGFASEMLCGGVLLLVVSWLSGEHFHWPPTPLAAAAWAYLVVFGSLIAFTAYMTLLSRTRAALATSYTFINPVISLLLGIGLGEETVSPREWLAAGIVVLGMVTLMIGKLPAEARSGLVGPATAEPGRSEAPARR